MYGISPRKKYTEKASVKNMKPFVILYSISVQRKPPYQGKLADLIYGYNIGKKDIIDDGASPGKEQSMHCNYAPKFTEGEM